MMPFLDHQETRASFTAADSLPTIPALLGVKYGVPGQ
jgi:hypothetical protein